MKTYAAAYINFFDNALTVSIVVADSWKEALKLHMFHSSLEVTLEIACKMVDSLSDDYETALSDALNQDWQFAVKEIQ